MRHGAAPNCMTLHDTFLSANPYFLSFPAIWPFKEKDSFSLVF